MISFAVFYQNSIETEIRVLDTIINKLVADNKNIKIYYFISEKIKFNYVKNSHIHLCPNLKYLVKMSSDRIYQNFLQFCIKKKIQFAFIYRLNLPEFFLNDLNFYKKLDTKFILMDQSYSLVKDSPVRSNVVLKIIKHQNIKKFIFDSPNGGESNGPKYFEKYTKKLKQKIVKWHQWRDSEPQVLNRNKCRKKLNLPNNKFIILFFGAPFYGKGIDIIISAFKYLNKDFFLLLSSNLKIVNFEYNFHNLKKYKKFKSIKVIDRYVSTKERENIFGAADVVCLPYRKSYLYHSSAVLTESVLFNKFFIAPNFDPFNQFVNKYKNLGLLFKAENIKSLVDKIKESKKIYLNKNYKKDREKYLKNSIEANNLHKVILNVINSSI